jgi:M6 family metalloprotease-like protein
METRDGYTILRNQVTGFWDYAVLSVTGELIPSGWIVGIHPPAGLVKHLRDGLKSLNRLQETSLFPLIDVDIPSSLKALVILVEFKNRKLVDSKPADWEERFFGDSSSVNDYFAEVSFGAFDLVPADEKFGTKNDGIVKVKLNMKHPNTKGTIGVKNRKTTKKALQAANKYVDYSKLDLNDDGAISVDEAIFIIVCAGYEGSYGGGNAKTPNVWGHKWSLFGSQSAPKLDGVLVADYRSNGGYTQFGEWHQLKSGAQVDAQAAGHMATIGIMCHEVGHDMGRLPDLYDTDGSSEGIGNWGLMGSGSWNGSEYFGDSPSHLMGWSRYFLGWVTPKKYNKISKIFTIKNIEENIKSSLYLLGVNPGDAEYDGDGEYFLIENRQLVGYDSELPGSGLLIWHIDESKSSNDEEGHQKINHPLIDLEEADGKNDLVKSNNAGDDGDPFPGLSNNRKFLKTTKPHSKWYSTAIKTTVKVTNISISKKNMRAKLYIR